MKKEAKELKYAKEAENRVRLTELVSVNGLVLSLKALKKHEGDKQTWSAELLCLQSPHFESVM